MNNAKLAAAVGAGYVLGRMRKARWALALAGMAAGKKITTNPGALLADVLESSPQLRELAQSVSGDLIGAGAKAGVAAAGHRMEGLTERLEQRVESLRDSAGQRDEDEDEGEEEEEEAPKRKSTRGGGSGSRSASEKKSAPSKRSSTPRKRSTAPPSKKSPSRASSRSTAKKTTERKPPAKKTASSSPTRKSGGRSTSRSASGSRASTRKE